MTVLKQRNNARGTTVLLHGWGCDASFFEPFTSYLNTDTHRINYANNPHFEQQVIDEITQHSPCHLIAWSMGAMIAINRWADIKDHVHKLTILSTPLIFCSPENQSTQRLQQMIDSLQSNASRELKRFWRAAGPPKYRPPVVDLHTPWLKDTLEYLGSFNAEAQAAQIQIPTTIIQGTADSICLPAAGQALHHAIVSSKIYMVANASHAPFLDDPTYVSSLCTSA